MVKRLSADWLVTGTGEIIPFGSVLINSHGRLLAVGPDHSVPSGPSVPAEHFSSGILLPGLINAHTHLELTGLDGQAPEANFAEWIRTVIRLKSVRNRQDFLAASLSGLHQCFAAGITTVADTGDSGAPAEALVTAGGSGIAYLEIFGPDPIDASANLESFKLRVASLRQWESARVRIGVSPHAPYSVSGPLYRAVSAFAAEAGLPMAVHIAESEAESDLLMSGSGPFAQNWVERGIPLPPPPGRTPIEWLEQHGVLTPQTLCIHAVRAAGPDIQRLQVHQCSVAHCPRSNRRHGHGDAPLRELLDAGIRLGVGTDSPVSVSPPDLLAEARAAALLGGLDAARALHLVTLGAATALNLDHEVGSLEVDKWADIAILQLPQSTNSDRIMNDVLQSGPDSVLATFVGGRPVYRRTH